MSETSEPPKPGELSADDKHELQQFDVLIERERYARKTHRATARELRMMLWGNILLVAPLLICYLAMPHSKGRITATYIAVVAVVVAGWGAVRSLRANATAKPRGVGLLYGLVFAMLFLFYGTMLLSFTYVIDPESGKVLQTPQIVKP